MGIHIALSVTDVARSKDFYSKLIGSDPMVEMNDGVSDLVLIALDDGTMIGLRQHPASDPSDRFSHERVGLDHFAIHLDNRDELEKKQARLEELGTAHSGIQEGPFGLHLNFRDPDNIALEYFVAAQS
ncbi:MAG: VOC family protein [Actinomycetota bacterium]